MAKTCLPLIIFKQAGIDIAGLKIKMSFSEQQEGVTLKLEMTVQTQVSYQSEL